MGKLERKGGKEKKGKVRKRKERKGKGKRIRQSII